MWQRNCCARKQRQKRHIAAEPAAATVPLRPRCGAPLWLPKARPRALDSNQGPGTGTKVNAWSKFAVISTPCEAKRSLIALLLLELWFHKRKCTALCPAVHVLPTSLWD